MVSRITLRAITFLWPVDRVSVHEKGGVNSTMAFDLWRTACSVVLLLLVVGCGTLRAPETHISRPSTGIHLFDAETTIGDQWLELPLRGKTDYRLSTMNGQVAIRATGQQSASGIIREVAVDPLKCPVMEWSWAVTKLQESADLHVKAREDVAASMLLLFGDPGFLFDPKPVPTLRYVWTNGNAPIGTIIDNPYLPGIVRSIVIESGADRTGGWVVERRNVIDDFISAFGESPTDMLQAIVLFTDNDQTQEPVEAYYGWARVVCEP